MFYYHSFATLIMSSGELSRKESARSEEWSTYHLTVGAQNSFVAAHPPSSLAVHQHRTRHSSQLLQILRLMRKQASLLSCQLWSYYRVFAPAVPLLGLLLCWQSRCSFSHFFQKLAQVLSFQWASLTILHGIGPSHFLSSLLCFVLFFSALTTTWPILYLFILHFSLFE